MHDLRLQITYANKVCVNKADLSNGNLFDNAIVSHLIIFSQHRLLQSVEDHNVVTVHPPLPYRS